MSTIGFKATDMNYTRNFQYAYTYTSVGRVASQTMSWGMAWPGHTDVPFSFTMQYQWDNEGRMTQYTDLTGQPYVSTYDAMGRLGGLNGADLRVLEWRPVPGLHQRLRGERDVWECGGVIDAVVQRRAPV